MRKAFTELGRSFHTHKQQEIIAGDEDGGNNAMECDASNGSNMVAPYDNNSSIFEVHAILVIYRDSHQTEPIGINGSKCHTLS